VEKLLNFLGDSLKDGRVGVPSDWYFVFIVSGDTPSAMKPLEHLSYSRANAGFLESKMGLSRKPSPSLPTPVPET
jgi:hypothetical protein